MNENPPSETREGLPVKRIALGIGLVVAIILVALFVFRKKETSPSGSSSTTDTTVSSETRQLVPLPIAPNNPLVKGYVFTYSFSGTVGAVTKDASGNYTITFLESTSNEPRLLINDHTLIIKNNTTTSAESIEKGSKLNVIADYNPNKKTWTVTTITIL